MAKTNRLYDDVVVKLPIIIQVIRNRDNKDGDDDDVNYHPGEHNHEDNGVDND